MAELPDLTVFTHILAGKFKGKVLDKIEVTEARKLNVTAAQLCAALEGCELIDVTREGKTLQFHFSGKQVLGVHLMLRGELVELKNGETPRFQILAFHFKNGAGFAVVDLQKAATPTLQPKPVAVPDALDLDKAYFTSLLAKKRTVIKTFPSPQGLSPEDPAHADALTPMHKRKIITFIPTGHPHQSSNNRQYLVCARQGN